MMDVMHVNGKVNEKVNGNGHVKNGRATALTTAPAVVTEQPHTDQMVLLRHFVMMRDDTQRARIQLGNRLAAVERGDSSVGDFYHRAMQVYYDRYGNMEDELGGQIKELSRTLSDDIPLLADMQKVKGIGPVFAARLLVEVDFHKAETASSLWAYCGYAPGRDRPKKGVKLEYNRRARTICYLIGGSFLKSRSPYRAVYDSAAEYYAINRPEWSKLHRSRAALRKMMKRFLVHFYMVGRTRNNLPVRRPFVEARLGHTHIDRPEDYGWPALDYWVIEEPVALRSITPPARRPLADMLDEGEAELLAELEATLGEDFDELDGEDFDDLA